MDHRTRNTLGVGLAIGFALACCGCIHARRAQEESPDPGSDRPATSDKQSERGSSELETSGTTQIWLHGTGNTEKAQELGAKGVRQIIDVRKLRASQVENPLRKFADTDLGLCLTVRWKNSNNASSPWDVPPTDIEAQSVTDQLIEMFNTPEGKQMSGRLWIQFYNEITGGPGRFKPEQADRMFEWASDAAQRIRREAPHVKIAGPALSGIGVLNSDGARLNARRQSQREGLLRAIRWSARYADAVDLHLHVGDGRSARTNLTRIRELLDEEPGGSQIGIVVWEWSCAKFPDRSDSVAVRQTIIDIWHAMEAAGVQRAAYGGLWPPRGQSEVFQWKNLLTTDGKPNEPFYSTFKDIAAGRVTEDSGAKESTSGAKRNSKGQRGKRPKRRP